MSSSAKLNVTVEYEGTKVGEAAHRPVWKMPEGTAGVVYRGAVYPVYSDHSIKLSDEGVSKEDCDGFFAPGEELFYADAEEEEHWWFLEHTRYKSYLAFDGSEAFAERLNAAFEAEGLSGGYRESFRPAKDGKYYDYFIRLPAGVDDSDVELILSHVVDEEPAIDAHADALAELVDSLGGPAAFLDGLARLETKLQGLEAEREALKDRERAAQLELAAAREDAAALRKERGRLRAQATVLHKERDELRDQVNALPAVSLDDLAAMEDMLSRENDRLKTELATLREEFVENAEAYEQAKEEVPSLLRELEHARKENTALQHQVDRLQNDRNEAATVQLGPSRSKREKQLLNDLLSGAFPRLEFKNKDFQTMLRSFSSLHDCAKVFAVLQLGDKPPKCKPFVGHDGVWEIPGVRTGVKGRERMGRIYFKPDRDGDKVQVRVQFKTGDGKQQNIFVSEGF